MNGVAGEISLQDVKLTKGDINDRKVSHATATQSQPAPCPQRRDWLLYSDGRILRMWTEMTMWLLHILYISW